VSRPARALRSRRRTGCDIHRRSGRDGASAEDERAVAAGVVALPNVVKKLRERPQLVKRLRVYDEQVGRIPLMGVEIAPVDLGAFMRSAAIRERYGLLVNDSLVVAGVHETNAAGLASADGDFKRVTDLKVFRPGDLG
jgi:predicted nucleic acid-binding protein